MRIYLDSNALIEAVEGRSIASEQLRTILETASAYPPQFVTSELTLAELLVKPMELGRADLVDIYESILASGDAMEVAPIDRFVLRGAALLRSHEPSLKLVDAIHLATAGRTRCTHFVSNDRRIRSREVEVVRLTERELTALGVALSNG